MSSNQRIAIDIWSDYVCPFCYLELPLIDELAQEFEGRLDITWRAFELRPEPAPLLEPNGKYLQDIWTRTVYPLAQERGMTLRLPPLQARSRKAFEAALHAQTVGRFGIMHAGLFRAFFQHGDDIGDLTTLLALAATLHIDAGPLQDALESERHRPQVEEDRQLALALGIQGVPFFIVRSGRQSHQEGVPLRGAVPYERLRAAVMQFT